MNMKKYLLLILFLTSITLAIGQTTATDFTVNDCSGNSHHLFAELNAGKVIVISFVMPCATCIGPTKTADAAVQSYASSNPGQVLFYLSDDEGTTPCNTLNSWATTNAITPDAIFGNTSVKQDDYGTPGMPKVVVLGGASHTIYYNQNSGFTQTNIQNAIKTALAAISGVNENKTGFQLNLYPNPVINNATVAYTLTQASDVSIDIYNMLGVKIKNLAVEKQTIGKYEAKISFETLNNGVYFVRLNTNTMSEIIKIIVSH
jgi:hypothetical protein